MMRLARTLVLALAVVAWGFSAPLTAQEPVRSFDQLNTRLKTGDNVWLTDAAGVEFRGRILRVTPSSLVLDGGRPRTFDAGDVAAVRERAGSAIGKGAMWGTVAGAAAGLAMALRVRGEFAGYCSPDAPPACFPQPGTKPPIDWWSVPVYAGLGAGIGTVVGALVPGRMRDVYRAPAATSATTRLSIAPVVGALTKGVTLAISF